jgi:hypothetical protein
MLFCRRSAFELVLLGSQFVAPLAVSFHVAVMEQQYLVQRQEAHKRVIFAGQHVSAARLFARRSAREPNELGSTFPPIDTIVPMITMCIRVTEEVVMV